MKPDRYMGYDNFFLPSSPAPATENLLPPLLSEINIQPLYLIGHAEPTQL